MPWPQRNTFRQPLNYVAACATELAAPLLRAYARAKVGGASPTPPQQWRKALLIGENHIGDVLYRTASLAWLKQGLPDCEFDFIAPPPACEVLKRNPALRQVHPFERPTDPSSETFAILKAEQYDAAICYNTHLNWRPLKLAVDLGIPNRAGYTHKGFSGWVTHPMSIHYPQPFPAYFRDMVSQLTGFAPEWDLTPRIYPDLQDEADVAAVWSELGLDANRPVLACFCTTRQATGVWPEEKFLETLRDVARQAPVQIILCGATEDETQLKAMHSRLDVPCHVLAGRLGLRALVLFLKRCDAVLGTDSGPRHLAHAAGVPVVYLHNLRVSKIETGPYCAESYDLAPDVEWIDPGQQAAYLDQVQPERVAAKLLELLKAT